MQLSSTLNSVVRRARNRAGPVKLEALHRLRRLRGVIPKQKVDFLVAGVPKGGTNALDAYLREHPQICMADIKEVHFFHKNAYFSNGVPDYSQYHVYFSPKKEERLLGEASPGYNYSPALQRIRDYNPDMKFILLLRNPADRAYSDWNMHHNQRTEPRPFSEVIRSRQTRQLPPPWSEEPLASLHFYVRAGFYMKQLELLWKTFPRERTLILKSETLRAKPQETLDKVFDFLGVPSLPAIHPKEAYVGTYEGPMSQEDRRYLLDLFAKDNDEVERVLGWDCSDWRK